MGVLPKAKPRAHESLAHFAWSQGQSNRLPLDSKCRGCPPKKDKTRDSGEGAGWMCFLIATSGDTQAVRESPVEFECFRGDGTDGLLGQKVAVSWEATDPLIGSVVFSGDCRDLDKPPSPGSAMLTPDLSRSPG